MCSDVLFNGFDQFWHASEHAAFQTISRQTAEEALDHVKPRCRSWREVHVETWMFRKPGLYRPGLRNIHVSTCTSRQLLHRGLTWSSASSAVCRLIVWNAACSEA